MQEWKAEPAFKWNRQTPRRQFSRPWHTTHLFLVLTYALTHHPRARHTVHVGSMHAIRVGSEEAHSVAPQDGLIFTLDLAPPNLRNTIFPPFLKSEQGTTYGNGLREEPRDP